MALWGLHVPTSESAEAYMLSNRKIVIGWTELHHNLSDCTTKLLLEKCYLGYYPSTKKNRMLNHVRQLFAFVHTVKLGDLVIIPCKKSSQVAIAQVSGPYQYMPHTHPYLHTRSIKWLKTDVPINSFGQDLRFSIRAFLSFFQIARNDAESRVKTIVSSGKDPMAKQFNQ